MMGPWERYLRNLASQGLTQTEIVSCKRYGIILERKGARTAAQKAEHSQQKREDRSWRIFGCSVLAHAKIKEIYGVVDGYTNSKSAAGCRDISFEMTLPEWWHVWRESGKFASRGRGGDDYVMCRVKDMGPYKIGNVFIATSRDNIKSYHRDVAGHHGVMCTGPRFIARRRIDGKPVHLGTFNTEAEAHQAFLDAENPVKTNSIPSQGKTAPVAEVHPRPKAIGATLSGAA